MDRWIELLQIDTVGSDSFRIVLPLFQTGSCLLIDQPQYPLLDKSLGFLAETPPVRPR
jgi:hypothetical protein